MKSTILKEELQAKVMSQEALIKAAEGRDFTADEQRQYETLIAGVAALETKIDNAIEQEAILKKAAEMKATTRTQPKDSPEAKVSKEFSFIRAIRSQLPTNSGLYLPLDGVEKEMHQEAEREAKKDSRSIEGVGVPSFFLHLNGRDNREMAARGLTVGTTTTGGHTVETSVGGLIPFLEPKLVLERLGMTMLPGLTGNLDLPRNDAQGSGAWEGEGDANAEEQPTFDKVSLSPKRYGGYIYANKQLLLQSSIGIENFMRRRIEMNLAQALDTAGINGSGAGGQPLGLLGLSIGSAAAGVPTWAKTVELETDVATANADFGRMAYLTTPGIRGKMKTTTKEAGEALYLWTGGGSGTGEGEVNGYRAIASTLVPSTLGGGAQHALIFGNWEELIFGQWGGIDLVVDPYSLVRNAQVQIVANVWCDFDVFHPLSFSHQLCDL